ncbi:MAG: tandem-95 repeat protein, partial [Desulfobulbaceae bacterium]|nr:tandem-95 repeat protein [Candidatus Desulfobia pelagia]
NALDFDTDNNYQVQVTATDNGIPVSSAIQSISVSVTDVNEPPTAINISNNAVDELIDTTGWYSIGILTSIDPDVGDTFSFSVVGGADQGDFGIGGAGSNELLISDGVLDFETKPSYDVIVRTTDSGNLTFDQIITITIIDINDPPEANDDSYTVNEDTPNINFTVLINDTDPEGDTLTVFAVGTPDQGGTATISGTNDSIVYTPFLDFYGTETFTYTADDNNGGTDTSTVTVTILPVPDPPIADDLSFSTTVNTDIYDYVSGSDPDGDLFAFYFPPVTGSLGEATLLDMHTIEDFGGFHYHPQNGVTGVDTFTYYTWKPDPNGDIWYSNPATITITIYAENFAPVAYDGLLNVVMDTPSSGTLTMTDPNSGGSHIYSILANGSLGTAVIDNPSTGTFTYTPNPGATGTDSFTYKVNDSIVDSNEATITVSILDSAALMVIKRISITPTEETYAGSYRPSLSSDGRYISFNSYANNLVNGVSGGQIYIYDRVLDTMELVSQSNSSDPGDDTSDYPSINGDGQYVAFSSFSSNLVTGDTDQFTDIFVRDIQSGQTEIISINDLGVLGNNTSHFPSINDDGRYVAFESTADNLVINDTNTVSDIFVHDRLNNTTERISISSTGDQANRDSSKASISQDGRYVAFESSATNLVAGITGSHIFVHDRQTGNTGIVSISSAAVEGNGRSDNPSISADGRYVVFGSFSTNLIANDTNGVSDIFVHDRQTGATSRISVSSAGAEGDFGSSCYHQNSISEDGQYIIFESDATNLVAGDTNGAKDIFVHDQSTEETRRISTSTFGAEGDNQSWWPSISADGQVNAFSSEASNLVGNDTNNSWDVFIVHPFNN